MNCPVSGYTVPETEYCLACGAKISQRNGTMIHGEPYRKSRKRKRGGPVVDGGGSKLGETPKKRQNLGQVKKNEM